MTYQESGPVSKGNQNCYQSIKNKTKPKPRPKQCQLRNKAKKTNQTNKHSEKKERK